MKCPLHEAGEIGRRRRAVETMVVIENSNPHSNIALENLTACLNAD
jgi:hypothetical protein